MSLYQKLKEYCNYRYPRKYKKLFYIDEEDMLEPSLELFLYNVWRQFLSWTPIYTIKYFLQKVFRKDHLSNAQIWEAYDTIARKTLPVLLAYRKSDRNGWPGIYSEYHPEEGMTKERWEEMNPKAIGGEMEGWNKDLDEMIFAFEYTIYRDNWHSEFWKKYFGEYLDEIKPENKHEHICYNFPGNKEKHIGAYITFSKEELPPGSEMSSYDVYYHNRDLEEKAFERAQKGLELYAKRFFSIWD